MKSAGRDCHDRFSRKNSAGAYRDWYRTACGAVGAKLQKGISAPREDLPVRGRGEAVDIARCDCQNRFARKNSTGTYRDRDRATCGGVVAKLPVGIIAPREDLSVRGQRQAVDTTSSDCHNRFPGKNSAGAYRDRDGTTCGAVVAKPSGRIIAPGEDLPIRGQRQAVISTRSDSNNRFSRKNPTGAYRDRDGTTCGAVVAKLSGGIIAPREDLPVRGRRQAVISACCDSNNRFSQKKPTGAYRDRKRTACGAVVAKLPVGISAPCEDLPVRGQHQVVGSTRCESNNRFFQKNSTGAYRDRDGTTCVAFVAKLPVGIKAPRGWCRVWPLKY